jgi:hypothetical protein
LARHDGGDQLAVGQSVPVALELDRQAFTIWNQLSHLLPRDEFPQRGDVQHSADVQFERLPPPIYSPRKVAPDCGSDQRCHFIQSFDRQLSGLVHFEELLPITNHHLAISQPKTFDGEFRQLSLSRRHGRRQHKLQ